VGGTPIAWKYEATSTIVLHEEVAILFKNPAYFSVPEHLEIKFKEKNLKNQCSAFVHPKLHHKLRRDN